MKFHYNEIVCTFADKNNLENNDLLTVVIAVHRLSRPMSPRRTEVESSHKLCIHFEPRNIDEELLWCYSVCMLYDGRTEHSLQSQ